MPNTRRIAIPDFALVAVIGPTGARKSTFARAHFLETEIVSPDHCRAQVSDDETDQSATADGFDLLHYTAGLRLKQRKIAVVDVTSARREDRASLARLARQYHALPVALVLNVDAELCDLRKKDRPNRGFGEHVARKHVQLLQRGIKGLEREGFRHVHVFRTPDEISDVEIVREPLWTDRRREQGPFDIIGDVHGCFDELSELLLALGYQFDPPAADAERLINARHPEGREAFFVGDLCDRGPRNVDVLRLVMGMCADGAAHCVMGNHDNKLGRWLQGRNISVNHGLQETINELEETSEAFKATLKSFLGGLRSHAWLAGGKLVVAHAGLKEEMHGRDSGEVRSFALFGETTGEIDEFGLPVRLNWAQDYRGRTDVVYGHTPVPETAWLNNTMCVDTGCVFGGKLSALRWPEREVVSVAAKRQYAAPARPFGAANGNAYSA